MRVLGTRAVVGVHSMVRVGAVVRVRPVLHTSFQARPVLSPVVIQFSVFLSVTIVPNERETEDF